MTAKEEWRPAPHAPDYEASNLGRVRSIERVVTYRDGRTRKYPSVVLSQFTSAKGYQLVTLRVEKRHRAGRVHAMVLEAFTHPRPDGMIVMHLNGDPSDNRLENLKWGTPSENSADVTRHGRHKNALKTHCVHGHEYTPENTYVNPGSGWRDCRTCRTTRANGRRELKRLGLVGPANQEKTHCKYGHPFSGENLYVYPSGGRGCRQCRREVQRGIDSALAEERRNARGEAA